MDIPVLVLSSHDRDDQIVEGLEVGPEDYVSKPFNLKELLLRIEKILRRTKTSEASASVLVIGNLSIDMHKSIVSIEGEMVNLTPTEYRIVEFLAKHAHTPVSSEMLLQGVWNAEEWIQGPEMVKVNISRLRKKLEKDPSNPRYLLNRWGYGYLLTDTSLTGK
jgi:DNA-binding response OmpR family regulator